jgi:hypothetical protein
MSVRVVFEGCFIFLSSTGMEGMCTEKSGVNIERLWLQTTWSPHGDVCLEKLT